MLNMLGPTTHIVLQLEPVDKEILLTPDWILPLSKSQWHYLRYFSSYFALDAYSKNYMSYEEVLKDTSQ